MKRYFELSVNEEKGLIYSDIDQLIADIKEYREEGAYFIEVFDTMLKTVLIYIDESTYSDPLELLWED